MSTRLLETYEVKVVLLTPARVGGGVEGNLQQLLRPQVRREPVLRQVVLSVGEKPNSYRFERTPLIPATTLKGLLRSLTEKLAATIYKRYQSLELENLESTPLMLAANHHQPTPQEEEKRREKRLQQIPPLHAKPEQLTELQHGNNKIAIHKTLAKLFEELKPCVPEPPEASPKDWSYEAFASRYCPICMLYGSTHQAGAVRPLDAIPPQTPDIEVRTHVAIDRGLGIRSEKKLYTEELLQAGTTFKTRIHILWPLPTPEEQQNPTCNQLYQTTLQEAQRLWKTLLEYLNQTHIQIGSGKTRGNGLAKITIRQIR